MSFCLLKLKLKLLIKLEHTVCSNGKVLSQEITGIGNKHHENECIGSILKDVSCDILYFSDCQQIPWKD